MYYFLKLVLFNSAGHLNYGILFGKHLYEFRVEIDLEVVFIFTNLTQHLPSIKNNQL